ncbi:MAG: FAD-binding protein, partial [Candidatus Sumerlaeota bacterium]
MTSNAIPQPDFPFAHADYRLAPHTWYRVGGPADWALIPESRHGAIEAAEWVFQHDLPFLILGGGTNVLISDKGFRGVVLIVTELRELEELEPDRYYGGAGLLLDKLVREVLLENNYQGVGALAGIPGSVGGAIYMNAGTSNGSICEMLESVDLIRPSGLDRVPVTPASYAYRSQSFCESSDVILGGTFRFYKAETDQKAIYEHYLRRRKENQPGGYC